MSKICTNSGEYSYEDIELFIGRKIIDKKISKNNLLDFKKILDANSIPFCLMYGTLLGAIRENDFIDYDEDIDIYILDEYREGFLNLLFELRKNGFEVARYLKSDLLSIIRENEYIDIYFFKKTLFGSRVCLADTISGKYLENSKKILFLGEQYSIPFNYERILEILYGKSWRIPKRNLPGKSISLFTKTKLYLRNVVLHYLKIKLNQLLQKSNR